jgi:aspartate aminotransferase
VYRDFIYDGCEHISVLSLPGLDEHSVMIDSVSKRYSACGARIGVLVTKNKEVYATAMKFAQARLSPSTLGQILSEALCDTTKAYFDEVKAEYDKRRMIVVDRLKSMQGVMTPTPNGAFYAMIQLPIDDSDKFEINQNEWDQPVVKPISDQLTSSMEKDSSPDETP